jgi:hypothetical protein
VLRFESACDYDVLRFDVLCFVSAALFVGPPSLFLLQMTVNPLLLNECDVFPYFCQNIL